MTQIYQFPPVGVVSWLPTVERRVRTSRYAPGGEVAVSSDGPARRVIDLTVSALSRDRAGFGYMEELWSLIDGGIGFVRLTLPPVNWHLDRVRLRQSVGNAPLKWSTGSEPLGWTTNGEPLQWFMNTIRTGTAATVDGQPALTVTGLPPGIVVARPGDIVRVYAADHTDLGTARVRNLVRVDISGAATVIVSEALPSGIVSFSDEEIAVFRMVEYSPQPWRVGQNTTVQTRLREALPSEYAGATDGYVPW